MAKLFPLILVLATLGALAKPSPKQADLLLVVMDPLAKELACACVDGYGQRDYRKLAARLEATLKQPVTIEFSDDLAESLSSAGAGQQVIAVGDQSLVAHGATKAGLKFHAICDLSGTDGETTLGALFVARSDDPAKELRDLDGRTVFFGVLEADAKYDAAANALRDAGIASQVKIEKRSSYSEAALDVLDSQTSPPPVAVIPGYALRLLEGCKTIKPGNLKVIGKTRPVPFITVLLSDNVPPEKEQKILKTLLAVKEDKKMLRLMESRDGFKPVKTAATASGQAGACWPDWRGPGRDGHTLALPRQLPVKARFIWKKAAMQGGLAGLSVSDGRLILAERDVGDEADVYRCFNANNGDLFWRLEFPAKGKLDYGQSPRATPVMHDGKAYLLGAFGDLRCVNVADGKILWERQLPREFQAELPTWGMCSTPLIVDDLLIVNPGATNASVVALDRLTGRTRWAAPGAPAAYAAFICGKFGGRRQIVGYDQLSLGGWDAKTGERLWRLVPPASGDFNVPTPIATGGGLVLATENNGTRFYRFDQAARIIAKPASEYADLAPDTATPVVTCGRLFGTRTGLHCLEIGKGLKPIWHHNDDALSEHASLIADDQRVLVITMGGELILLDGRADKCAILSRLRLFEEEVEMYSHPAIVGSRLFVRGGATVACVDLETN